VAAEEMVLLSPLERVEAIDERLDTRPWELYQRGP
jgi:hypothetical protein